MNVPVHVPDSSGEAVVCVWAAQLGSPRLPRWRAFDGVQVVEPTELLAMKVISMVAREGREKGLTDRLDLHRLLRAFPQLREKHGEVAQRLQGLGVPDKTLIAWQEVVALPLAAEPDDE